LLLIFTGLLLLLLLMLGVRDSAGRRWPTLGTLKAAVLQQGW
jgi:hypothetical protein